MKKTALFLCVSLLVFQISAYAADFVLAPDSSIKSVSLEDYPDMALDLRIAGFQTDGVFEIWQATVADKTTVTIPRKEDGDLMEHHDRFKAVIVLEGEIGVTIGKAVIDPKGTDLGKGTIVYLPPYTPHAITLTDDDKILMVFSGFQDPLGNALQVDMKYDTLLMRTNDLDEAVAAKQYDEVITWDENLFQSGILDLKVSNDQTHFKYEIWGFNLPPGGKVGLHEHYARSETMIIVEGGNHVENERGEKTDAVPGSIIFMPPYTPHALEAYSDDEESPCKMSKIISIFTPGDYYGRQFELDTFKRYHPELYPPESDPNPVEWLFNRYDSFYVK